MYEQKNDRSEAIVMTQGGFSQTMPSHKVLRNTYGLLGMTIGFAAIMTFVGMALQLGFMSALVCSVIGFVLLFVVDRTADSAKGLFVIFAFTGVEGLALAPLVSHFLASQNGALIVTQALAATSLVSFVLSAYAIKSGKDFSYMRGFLLTGLIVMLVAGIANIFLHMPALQLAIAAGGAIIASGLILFDTSRIINGGETNYIRATLSLFIDIKLLFVSLLQLLGAANDD